MLANWNAQLYEKESCFQNLMNQLIYPIHWMQSMQRIYKTNPNIIIEVGPKEVLSYISKKNNTDVQVLSMDKMTNLEKIFSIYENNSMR